MKRPIIMEIEDSQIYSKIQDGKYLEDRIKEGDPLPKAICEWFHYVKLRTHGKLPSVRNMNLDRGIDAINKLVTLDEQVVEDIILALNVSFTDNFWKNNLLTVGQLRIKCSDGVTKYEKLFMKIPEGKTNDRKYTGETLKLL